MANQGDATFSSDIVLIDIVGFSKLSTPEQVAVANVFTEQSKKLVDLLCAGSFRHANELVLGTAPTGDGFYLVLHPGLSGFGVFLAISLRSSLLVQNKRRGGLFEGVRCVAHHGDIAPFKDISGKINFVGNGMNESARLLGANPLDCSPRDLVPDGNFVVMSDAAERTFSQMYPASAQLTGFLEVIRFKKGEVHELTDKHGQHHHYRFIECSRAVAINPPKPPDLKERLAKIAAEHAG